MKKIINCEKGASLVETLLAILTLSAIAFLIANIPGSFNLVNKSRHLSIAREIGTKAIEDKRALNFPNLVNDTLPITDPRISILPAGAGTIIVEDCPQEICSNSEVMKQLTVIITWKEGLKDQKTVFNTLIGQGGLSK